MLAKLMYYHNIVLEPTIINKLLNSHVCKRKVESRLRDTVRVFTRTELNIGLKKLGIADKMKKQAKHCKVDHKKPSKEFKLQNEALEK